MDSIRKSDWDTAAQRELSRQAADRANVRRAIREVWSGRKCPERRATLRTAWGLCLAVGSLLATAPNLGAHEGHPEREKKAAEAITQAAGHLQRAYEARPSRDPDARPLVVDFEAPQRTTVDFLPLKSQGDVGVRLGSMMDGPLVATHDLLREVLSDQGYLRVQTIQSLEDVLRHTESRRTNIRLVDDYAVRLFGAPAGGEPWGMKYQGHHVSVNLTVVDGKPRGTPLFLGANPAQVLTGPRLGLRALAPQEDLGLTLLGSLTERQKKQAVAPAIDSSIVRGPLAPVRSSEGLSAAELTDAQTRVLFALVRSYASNLRPSMAAAELARIEDAGLDRLHFVWSGSTERTEEHYYRVQGPTVQIEFHSMNGNHIHTLWRDPQRDFGADLLGKHLEEDHGRG